MHFISFSAPFITFLVDLSSKNLVRADVRGLRQCQLNDAVNQLVDDEWLRDEAPAQPLPLKPSDLSYHQTRKEIKHNYFD